MNIKEIKEMIALMNENHLLELEIEKEGMRIRLKKESVGGEKTSTPSQIVTIPQFTMTQESIQSQPKKEESAKNLIEINAPMVGTFYRAPSPESQPFIEVGQIVEIGQVVCIIEAMKLMNEIKSEVKGKVVEALVENGHPVEFGQPLFLIEPV
ncbi:MAG: acetyl-CoA carboxylase biotin carboxyl carrier protein [Candidatus Omnitrophica bacterium]|nr:acetyl-CoA carboxylase biotin carboxyl carrier protein [Candidatus Omnitrophota bacterium]MDD5352301.1 acetyl-CoA carboxylase biotin carboxyl carrier protein [Candidatus Omnitrophota bacterium]MDD5549899.1 acetyl-CoA carboxylase biotin carboxyl carrier protein [Candidatus Omnitrophota bacterium]